MRSVVVVFPASMWAMMPMFRVFSRGTCRAMSFFLRNSQSAHTWRRYTKSIVFSFPVARSGTAEPPLFLCYPVETELRENRGEVRTLGCWDVPTAQLFFVLTS